METKLVLIVSILGVAILSGCIGSAENTIEGTYALAGNANDNFTLYDNGTYVLHYSTGGSKTGHYEVSGDILVFKNYYAGSNYIFEQETDGTFVNNIGGRYVKQ